MGWFFNSGDDNSKNDGHEKQTVTQFYSNNVVRLIQSFVLV